VECCAPQVGKKNADVGNLPEFDVYNADSRQFLIFVASAALHRQRIFSIIEKEICIKRYRTFLMQPCIEQPDS